MLTVGGIFTQVVYEENYYARDSGTLEQLKELSTKRQAIEESINGSSKITPAIAREMAGGITSPILQVEIFPALGSHHNFSVK